MSRITVEFVLSHQPCWDDAAERLPRLLGPKGLTLRECAVFAVLILVGL